MPAPPAQDPAPPPADESEQELDKKIELQVEERSAPGGHIVYGAIEKEGEDELRRSNSALAWSGLAAGLSMGFSMVAEALLTHHLPDAAWRPLIAKLGYGMGFLIVVLGRQQLFTENTLTVILPLLQRRDLRTFVNVLRLWGIVLAANLLGAFAFAWVAGHTSVFEPDLRAEFATIGRHALAPAFHTLLLRGVFAGWLIALMVWLMPFAETSRLWVILDHHLPRRARKFHPRHRGFRGSPSTSWRQAHAGFGVYVGGFLVPTLLGNILGGVSLVAALAHAQFIATEQQESKS